jgi:hypothetical protein
VAFGSEVQDGFRLNPGEQVTHERTVVDVSTNKLKARIATCQRQIAEITGVSE